MQKLYTVPEIATILRVKPPTVYGWIKNHKLESIRVGRLIRLTEEQLSAFMRPNGGGCDTETVAHVQQDASI